MAKIRTVVRPHPADADVLRKSAEVYARGKTPEITREGKVTEIDLKPVGPGLAAEHVREIHGVSGDGGVRQTIRGLQATRGNQFVLQMLAIDPGLQELIHSSEQPRGVVAAVRSSQAGHPVPAEVRDQFEAATGHDVSDVRLMNDGHSHEAAAAVGASAFTVGQRIFFGAGKYSPRSGSGRELIFHELFHTVQQRGATMPALESLQVASPEEGHERQAEGVARSVFQLHGGNAANDGEPGDEPVAAREVMPASPVSAARIQRAITFSTKVGPFNPHKIEADEDPAGFGLTSTSGTFEWQPDVTIHGNAGDAFAEWQTAHHQVGKGFWLNVWWGTGANRAHRRREIVGGLPMRDATAAGNTWYSDWRAQSFVTNGETKSPVMRDTPSTGTIPWANPIAGRGGTRGWFNYGFGFVSTLSARHVPTGTGAAAFRHLNHAHWNFDVDGTFDVTAPVGSRVALNGGAINRSGMTPGIDAAFPPIHGGSIINDSFK